jgi:hypothetical protein
VTGLGGVFGARGHLVTEVLHLGAEPARRAFDPFAGALWVDAHVASELVDVGLTGQALDRLADLSRYRPKRLAEILAVVFVSAHVPMIAECV